MVKMWLYSNGFYISIFATWNKWKKARQLFILTNTLKIELDERPMIDIGTKLQCCEAIHTAVVDYSNANTCKSILYRLQSTWKNEQQMEHNAIDLYGVICILLLLFFFITVFIHLNEFLRNWFIYVLKWLCVLVCASICFTNTIAISIEDEV